jgi:hypothetical protein
MEPLKLPADWETLKKEFFRDDAFLRDIVIPRVHFQVWEDVLAHLKNSTWPLKFKIDHVVAEIPDTADAVFAIRERASPMLSVTVDGMEFNTYFHDPEEIEFDLLAEDVHSPERLLAVMSFMKAIGQLTGNSVLLAMETVHEAVIMKYEISLNQFSYFPCCFRMKR